MLAEAEMLPSMQQHVIERLEPQVLAYLPALEQQFRQLPCVKLFEYFHQRLQHNLWQQRDQQLQILLHQRFRRSPRRAIGY
ncbi:hypothetical protein ElyMa_006515000 [Elysia marginata]|uniref:Uncharacterized protein n=1 Tax=Elysia marginata TaxID=1093978 RepID=A0AAV4I570_9GAST|nr:hypothetical protein ElyMa_006515000 [Elysia marginata]